MATGCKPCTDYHFKKVRTAGASDQEIKQAIAYAIKVRDSARELMENHGMQQLGYSQRKKPAEDKTKNTRIKELVSVAAAFAVNCTTNLKRHVKAARQVGITEEEIESVLDAASFIKGEATHYVEQIVKHKAKSDELQQLLDELKRTQAQLVQSEKTASLGKLVAGVVHELNTPIGTIISTTDVALRSSASISEIVQKGNRLEDIKNNNKFLNALQSLQDNAPVTQAATERIIQLIKSFKSFSRLDEAVFQSVNIHEGLESTLVLLEPEISKKIQIKRFYGDIPKINCYPGELNQVFMHLLTNAAHAIKEEGIISIKTYQEDANVFVEISDTGIGIHPDQVGTIFDPSFTKVGSRVKAGLGLFTSYNIVRNHMGHIKVRSKEGKGSTFTVILPQDLKKQLKPEISDHKKTSQHRCDKTTKNPVPENSSHRCESIK